MKFSDSYEFKAMFDRACELSQKKTADPDEVRELKSLMQVLRKRKDEVYRTKTALQTEPSRVYRRLGSLSPSLPSVPSFA